MPRYSGLNRRVGGPDPIPGGGINVMLFMQAATPLGWTRLNTVNDRAIRIIGTSGTGGATGGATAFSSVFGSGKTAGDTILSTAQIPSHQHTYYGPLGGGSNHAAGGSYKHIFSGLTVAAGGGGSHNHTVSLDLHYVDVIHCSKN